MAEPVLSPLKVVSLFAGVGGIDLAAEHNGLTTALVCEIDKPCRTVLAERFPTATIHDDVRTLTADDLRAAGAVPGRTVLTAGFPCQDLSVAGRRRGMGEGTRSGLYWEADRLLAEFRPAWVVLENVPGLLSAGCACPGDGTCGDDCAGETHSVPGGACGGDCIGRHGGVMGAVLGSLGQRGYGFAYRVLDARHFGVPQRRRRVVIVGHLADSGAGPAQVLLEPTGMLRDPAPRRQARAGTAGRARGSVASGPLIPETAATITAGISSTGVSAPGRRQEDDTNLAVYVADETSTLQVPRGGWRVDAEGAAGGHLVATAPIKATSVIVRRLTPLECERLQGFPDQWTDVPGTSDSQRYKQMGNSVAVPVFTWTFGRLVAVDELLTADRLNGCAA